MWVWSGMSVHAQSDFLKYLQNNLLGNNSCTRQRQLNFFCCMGWLVSKIIIIILSFRISISKNKNINHGVKQTCAIMSAQVTYETDHISVNQLCQVQ